MWPIRCLIMNNSFEDRVSQHFLFNSLNSAVALCRKDPEAAAGLILEISTYLQKSLEDKAFLIPLEEELEHVSSYVNIQKARFPDRLKIELDLEEDSRYLIPAYTLQPLLDNAIRHGTLKKKQGGTVILSIKKLQHSVRITVQDDGAGIPARQQDTLLKSRNKQHSLYKINHRLKMIGSDGLNVHSLQDEGTTVTFDIPGDLRSS